MTDQQASEQGDSLALLKGWLADRPASYARLRFSDIGLWRVDLVSPAGATWGDAPELGETIRDALESAEAGDL
jgi:hypothetical protein